MTRIFFCGTIVIALWLSFSSFPARANEPVRSPDALAKAVAAAKPGDEILIAAGRHENWDVEIKGGGTKESPIVIRPSEAGDAIFTGETRLLITGQHLVLQDLTFDGVFTDKHSGVVYFRGSQSCRLSRSQFIHARLSSSDPIVVFERGAADNRLDHCTFDDIKTRSVQVRIDNHSLEHGPPVHNRIDNNVFMNIPRLGRNGGETIQVGSRAYPYDRLESHTVIENNTFLRCNGEREIVCIKSTATTVRNNRFLHCEGELSLRHGGGNTVTGNLFVDCIIGVRISGPNQTVTDNTIINARKSGITLLYGTTDGHHPAAYLPVHDCLIANNTIIQSGDSGIFIGTNRNQKNHNKYWTTMPYGSRRADLHLTVPPKNNTIIGNTIMGVADAFIEHNHAPDNKIADNSFIEQTKQR